ncbi:MAG TPA: VacJ family lipoprotein [Myxococcota bacterium]|nr:VacJ family lipoprotein [Myxococcota bacterium]
MRGWGVLGVVVAALAAGCAYPVQRHDWSDYHGPGARYFHMEELRPPNPPDPLEPANRSVSFVNHVLVEGIAEPVGQVYRLIVPLFVRERLRDFAANLLWPRNLVANLLEAHFDHAGTETARFAINTTVGIGGLWDPAQHLWSIDPHPEDFGQVFGVWGWRPSTFLMLPVFGPSSVRDTVGLVPDTLLDPVTYFPFAPGAGIALAYNDLVDSIEPYRRFVRSSFDPYDDARIVWTIRRDEQISEPPPPRPEGDNTAAVQTLESAFLAPRSAKFWERLETGHAAIASTGRELPYSYRLQPGAAPVVYVVPGLGTHRLGNSTLALAEMAWQRGFSVVLVSNAMCFEFMENAASVSVPGHAPMDARDAHAALDAISRDLKAHFPGRMLGRVYMGYSLGAFHGFFIAASETDPANRRVSFDRYVLLDPPVRLVEGLGKLDRFYNAPLAYPPDERAIEVRRILRKAMQVAKQGLEEGGAPGYTRVDTTELGSEGLEPAAELPFTNLEAEYLIGLSFRRTLLSILWVSQQREDLGVLRTQRSPLRRWAAYEEMSEYSYTEYLYAFVLPYYRDHLGLVFTAKQLVQENDLHTLTLPLRANPKLRVFANTNDFLTTSEDVQWLTEVVGSEHVSLFPTGGHLGNLNRPSVQRAIMDSIEDLRQP